jgi:hypothetical protein
MRKKADFFDSDDRNSDYVSIICMSPTISESQDALVCSHGAREVKNWKSIFLHFFEVALTADHGSGIYVSDRESATCLSTS